LDLTVKPEELIGHSDFIRKVAKRLITDQELSADISQDAMVVALEHPPDASLPLRAWLGSVARNLTHNLIRRESRRARREWVAARPDYVPSTAEIVELEEIRNKVVKAVLNLKEPYRSVILLRFYQDLPPRKIAEIMKLPVETVKTRLKRSIEQLRKALGQDMGGDRKNLCLALAPLAGLKLAVPKAALPALAALLPTQAKSMAWAVILLLALTVPLLFVIHYSGILWGTNDSSALDPDPSEISGMAGVGGEDSATGLEKIEPLLADASLVENGTAVLRGRVLDLYQNPVTGAGIEIVRMKELGRGVDPDLFERFRAFSDQDGCFLFKSVPIGEYALLAVKGSKAGHKKAMVADPEDHPSGFVKDYSIVVKPWRSVRGRVVDPLGNPLTGVELIAYSPWPKNEPLSFAITDGSGHFTLKHLIEGECRIFARAEGWAPKYIRRVQTWTEDLVIDMDEGWFIQGQARNGSQLVSGAKIFISCSMDDVFDLLVKTETGKAGRFRLGPLPEGPQYDFSELDADAEGLSIQRRIKRSSEKEGVRQEVDLALIENGSASGSVLDKEKGIPLSGIWVTAHSIDEQKSDGIARNIHVRTGLDGVFYFPSLPSGKYSFWTHSHGVYSAARSQEKGISIVPTKETKDIRLLSEPGASALIVPIGMSKKWIFPEITPFPK